VIEGRVLLLVIDGRVRPLVVVILVVVPAPRFDDVIVQVLMAVVFVMVVATLVLAVASKLYINDLGGGAICPYRNYYLSY